VTGCGRLEGIGEDGKKWRRRSRKSSWEGERWIIVQEKERK
jgi:hypothetical protein